MVDQIIVVGTGSDTGTDAEPDSERQHVARLAPD